MVSTKVLYASTLLATGLAGFTTGFAVRPAGEARPLVLSERERFLHEWTENYEVTDADRDRLEGILDRYFAELEGLRAEFDRKYGGQVDDLRDRYDREIRAVLTPEKRR